jgi:glycosyltransferase involved in cell wall biosynthesis
VNCLNDIDQAIARYLEKHAERVLEMKTLERPDPKLRLSIVIPALAESNNIPGVIDSLEQDAKSPEAVELIIVVNNSKGAGKEVVEDNRKTIELIKKRDSKLLNIHLIDRASGNMAVDDEIAGVGTARRTGMDLALMRLVAAGSPHKSAIACLDADSPVASGYIDHILSVFGTKDPPLAGVCQCRHLIPDDVEQAQAIVIYELWLRFVEWSFRFCGSPYDFQTIGSCTIVSPYGYALADGMPRRKAGEDFYFLQKVAKVGGCHNIASLKGAVVCPSARISDRVPFGTGRAMRRCADEGTDYYSYVAPLIAYRELKDFFDKLEVGYKNPKFLSSLATPLREFIDELDGWNVLDKLRANVGDSKHFIDAVHVWFDSLQVVRYARKRQGQLGGQWIYRAILELFSESGYKEALDSLMLPDEKNTDLGLQIRWLDCVREMDSV